MRFKLLPMRGTRHRSRFTFYDEPAGAIEEAGEMHTELGVPIMVIHHSEDNRTVEPIAEVPTRKERRAAERQRKKAA